MAPARSPRRVTQVALLVLLGLLIGGGGFVAARLTAPLTRPAVVLTAAQSWQPTAGAPPPVPVPLFGSLAVDVLAGAPRRAASLNPQVVRPIASVAKAMTALVVLEQRPLVGADPGPTLTMTALDQTDYLRISAGGGSVAPVHVGERLSERDLLLGLMLPSANNMALTLARWVDGSVSAFVARLNARALALGMIQTHFADPDGLDAQTTSTAADLVLLGAHAVADPAFVTLVSTQRATLPDGTVVTNLDVLLGSRPDWIGVKTGWTPAAGGCLLFAARRVLAPGAPPITVVGAVLAQPPDRAADPGHPELGAAVRNAAVATDAVFAGYTAVRLQGASLPVSGSVRGALDGGHSGVHAAGADRWVVLHIGDALTGQAHPDLVSTPLPAGSTVGHYTVRHAGELVGSWNLVTDTGIADPSALARLLHW